MSRKPRQARHIETLQDLYLMLGFLSAVSIIIARAVFKDYRTWMTVSAVLAVALAVR